MSSKTGTLVDIPSYVSKPTQTWPPIVAIEIPTVPYFFSFSLFMAQALIIIFLHEITQTQVERKTGQFKRIDKLRDILVTEISFKFEMAVQ